MSNAFYGALGLAGLALVLISIAIVAIGESWMDRQGIPHDKDDRDELRDGAQTSLKPALAAALHDKLSSESAFQNVVLRNALPVLAFAFFAIGILTFALCFMHIADTFHAYHS
jgi:hypothetical protein